MDISDTKQLFEIYVFISKMEIPPQQQSIDQFKITLLPDCLNQEEEFNS